MSSSNQHLMNELEALLTFNNDQEKLELETELLHLNFIKAIEQAMKLEGLNKVDIANQLDTSKSYVTQLFSGSKLINMKTLAKLQRILNINFKVTAERKKTPFTAVNCGTFKKIYGVNSFDPGTNNKKYQIRRNSETLKLVV